MNPYILIPIKDIEERITELEANMPYNEEELGFIRGRKRELQNLLNIGKQISLDKSIIDIPFGKEHIRFENLSYKQSECLKKLSEVHQLSAVRCIKIISYEQNI